MKPLASPSSALVRVSDSVCVVRVGGAVRVVFAEPFFDPFVGGLLGYWWRDSGFVFPSAAAAVVWIADCC